MANVKELNINSTTYDIIGKGIVDQNNTSTPLKEWSGTKAQYDLIVTKDANTIYNITNDTNPTQSLLETLYPVGSIYIGTMNICPVSALLGTWTLISTKILTDIPATLKAKGSGIGIGITDGTNLASISTDSANDLIPNNQYGSSVGTDASGTPITPGKVLGITTDSTKSGIIVDTDATSLTVNIWQRTA